MAIFNSYVKLPQGITINQCYFKFPLVWSLTNQNAGFWGLIRWVPFTDFIAPLRRQGASDYCQYHHGARPDGHSAVRTATNGGGILLQLNHGDISTEFYRYHHQIHQISINYIYIICNNICIIIYVYI